jgi:hypothetical protein
MVAEWNMRHGTSEGAMILELSLVAGAIAVGVAAAGVGVQTVKTKHVSESAFQHALRLVPPEGYTCAICSVALTSANTKIVSVNHITNETLVVCGKTGCLIRYSQGVVTGGFQKQLDTREPAAAS